MPDSFLRMSEVYKAAAIALIVKPEYSLRPSLPIPDVETGEIPSNAPTLPNPRPSKAAKPTVAE